MTDERLKGSAGCAAQRLKLAWKSGEDTDLRQFLPAKGSSERLSMLVQLVKIDQQYRWRSGDQSLLEVYLEQWPELRENATAISELLEAECEIRAELGSKPTQEELQRRFPTLYEHVDLNTIAIDSGDGGEQAESDRSRRGLDTTPISQDSQPTPHPSWRLTPTGGKVGRYEIRAMIGAGGMGEVYRAFDTELQRDVALKIPRVDPGAKPELLARFIQEALAAASLRHPNICPVHDAGQIEDRYYIVMALIEGTNLADKIKEGNTDPKFAAQMISQLARALHTAHEAGIVHRDIKPANVLIDHSNQPLLTDFGLARRLDKEEQLSATGALLGTPAYMSPEQAELKEVDRRTDVYSLGVVLYQMLTGQLPFPGPPAQLLMQIVKGKPPRPSKLKPDLDPALETICLQAMARRPEHRYQSAAELADALEQYLQPPAAVPAAGRQRVLWAALIGVLLLAAGIPVLWGLLVGGGQGGPEPAENKLPLTPREREIAAVEQQIASLTPAIDTIANVREMEKTYRNVKSSMFGVNAQSLGRDIAATLSEFQMRELSEKESAVATQLDEFLAIDNYFKTPEDSYLMLRELAEMIDFRLARLQSQLSSLQESDDLGELAESDVTQPPPEEFNTVAERDWRLAETKRQLSGRRGADVEIEGLRQLEDRWAQARETMFGVRDAAFVTVAAHVHLARLYAMELNDRERAMYNAVREAQAKQNVFSRIENIYEPIRLFSETCNGSLQILRAKLAGLEAWTPESTRYETSIEMLSRSMQAECDRARLMAATGDRPTAIDIVSQLIEQSPEDLSLYALRATMYLDNSQFNDAQGDIERVLSQDDQSAYGYFLRGCLHIARKQYTLAVGDCDRATRIDPDLALAYCARAVAYNRVSGFSRAVEDCNEAIRIEPENSGAYGIRAFARVGLSEWDKALEDALESLRLNPLNAEAHYAHAIVLHHQQQYQQALQCMNKAIHLTSQVSDYYRFRADCYEKTGSSISAEGDRARALRIDEDARQQALPPAPKVERPKANVQPKKSTDDA